MSLTNTTNKAICPGTGSTDAFDFDFPVRAAAHLQVIYTNASGVETVLNPGAYSVTGIGNPTGGSVTYKPGGVFIASGTKLTLLRTVPFTQPDVLSNQGGYIPK